MPVEFYTLEPHREHVFFADRDQLQHSLDDAETVFKVFDTAPLPLNNRAAVFVVKGEQLLKLQPHDWISRQTHKEDFPGLFYPGRQALMVHRYLEQQPCYPFLKSIENGLITSQGVLFTRYLSTPLMKELLISDLVQRCVKRIYFKYPSLSNGNFFSHEDRAMLFDLSKFAIPVFWVDEISGKILEYIPKPNKDSGMFVPVDKIDTFIKATVFGIYGSNLLSGNFEMKLTLLMKKVLDMRSEFNLPNFNKNTEIALVTGGGPGVMEMGNHVAKNLDILSCANIVDFRNSANLNMTEQHREFLHRRQNDLPPR